MDKFTSPYAQYSIDEDIHYPKIELRENSVVYLKYDRYASELAYDSSISFSNQLFPFLK